MPHGLRKLQLIDEALRDNGSKYPISTDAQKIFLKDVGVDASDLLGFVGNIEDLFGDLELGVTNASSENPKDIIFKFQKSMFSYFLGLGAESGDFSNVQIFTINSGGVENLVFDDSADDTKHNSWQYPINELTGFNGIRLRFNTADPVSISNVVFPSYNFVVARLQAVSEETDQVEAVKSFKGALNVTDGLVHKVPVNNFFQRDMGFDTALSVFAISQDKLINVDSSVGYTPGTSLEIIDPTSSNEHMFRVITVVGNAITLDRPIDSAYPVGTAVRRVSPNMAVDGSVTPVSFTITPPAVGNESVYQFTRFMISMIHPSAGDDSRFGGITALTNGVVLRVWSNGVPRTHTIWRTNGDMRVDMYDVEFASRAPGGDYGTSGRWTITNAESIFETDGANLDYIEILIQDDLTDLDSFHIKGQGRIFGL